MKRVDLEQECFKSTTPMSYPVIYHVTTLGSSMDGFQQVWQFSIFCQTWQVRTCKIFHFLENHEMGDLEQEHFKSTLTMS